MSVFKEVRKELKQFQNCIHDNVSLPDLNKSLFMTYRILKCLNLESNTLELNFGADAVWGTRVLLGFIPWKESMFSWTAKKWSYFILEIMLKFKISNPNITIIPSYKIQPNILYKQYQSFIHEIHQVSSELIAKNSRYTRYSISKQNKANNSDKYTKVSILPSTETDMTQDIALMFNTMLNTKFRNFKDVLTSIKLCNNLLHFNQKYKYPTNLNIEQTLYSLKQTFCKAYTYHIGKKMYVRDDKCNIYNTHYLYIKSCFNNAVKYQLIQPNKNILHQYEYCRKLFFDLICLYVDKEMYSVQRGIPFWRRCAVFHKYVIPRRWRQMNKKYGMIIKFGHKKKCDVCGVIERVDGIEMELLCQTETFKNKKFTYVNKIYNCPCLAFYVCSRRCQKIGWTHKKFRHRDECSFINN